MDFWTFCSKIEGFVGLQKTLLHINVINDMYLKYFTVGQVVDAIKQTSGRPKNDPES